MVFVRDPEVHKDVLEGVLNEAEKMGAIVLGLDYSPIRGPEGKLNS
jgi:23S rRNA (cytidine1920-2'-O)/16S rRNA (cytidine1409-2'-O)-methyltransferase